jgi:hypothetical protein
MAAAAAAAADAADAGAIRSSGPRHECCSVAGGAACIEQVR